MMIKIFAVYLLLINIVTFAVYGLDKHKAKKDLWRIPESTLLLLAAIGGSIGAMTGMSYFRHKTKHMKFTIGVPVILLVQLFIIFRFLVF